MTILPFNKAVNIAQIEPEQDVEINDENFRTYFAMFSASEQLTLGLLMGRKNSDGETLFKDISLECNEHCASLSLSFDAQDMPYMHIDKIRLNGGQERFKLRRENMPEIIRDALNDIYEIARDDINYLLGEPAFDAPSDESSAPATNAVSYLTPVQS